MVKVLYRASSENTVPCGSMSFSSIAQQHAVHSLESLYQENIRLKEEVHILHQAKAKLASDKKWVSAEHRQEQQARERAEQDVRRLSKAADAALASKARLEEAFGRAMSDLRYERQEREQAEATIQQLLRELMLLRDQASHSRRAADAANAATAAATAAAATAAAIAAEGGAHGWAVSAPHPKGAAVGAAAASGAASATDTARFMDDDGGRLSRAALRQQLRVLRAAHAGAAGEAAALAAQLAALAAQKDRVEETQEMICRQAELLLADKRRLLTALDEKAEVVRGLEAGLDHLEHQLELAAAERDTLMSQLARVMSADDLISLTAVVTGSEAGASADSGLGEQDGASTDDAADAVVLVSADTGADGSGGGTAPHGGGGGAWHAAAAACGAEYAEGGQQAP